MHCARRIGWVTARRYIKARNGNPRPTTKPEQGPQYPLLACAKDSTSLPLDLASRHTTITAYTNSWPFHISCQADFLHPTPQLRCLQGSHLAGAPKHTHAPPTAGINQQRNCLVPTKSGGNPWPGWQNRKLISVRLGLEESGRSPNQNR